MKNKNIQKIKETQWWNSILTAELKGTSCALIRVRTSASGKALAKPACGAVRRGVATRPVRFSPVRLVRRGRDKLEPAIIRMFVTTDKHARKWPGCPETCRAGTATTRVTKPSSQRSSIQIKEAQYYALHFHHTPPHARTREGSLRGKASSKLSSISH